MVHVRAALAVFCCLASNPFATGAEPEKVRSVEGITEYRLDNGLRVLLFPDASRPKVTVNMTVFVGSRHEGYGETGMAHLLEHMVFKGTPTHRDIPQAMKERGAQFNGTTWVDRTNYFETLTASDENLEFAIRLEADRLVNSFVKREDLDTEMTVVRNEFEQGENSPSSVLSEKMMAAAFEWHNYGKSTIGNRSDIERVPIGNLQAFYRKFYQPDNALLIVAGKFDPAKALSLTQKYFGALPKPDRKLDTTYTEEPAQDGERVVTLRRVGDVGLVGLMYHVPAGPHPDFVAVQVLAHILDTEPSGRLYKALVEPGKAASVRAAAMGWHDPGVLEITAEVRKDRSLDEVRDEMTKVVESVQEKGVTEEEVRRARMELLKERELSATDTSRLAVRLSDWAAQGDWRLYFLHRDRLEKVTAEQVGDIAKRFLLRSNRTVGLFIPSDKPQRVSVPETPDLAKMLDGYKGREAISEGESFEPTPANIQARTQTSKTSQGLSVVVLPKKNRGESVQVQYTFRYGNAEDLKPFVAASEFLPQLMTRGTEHLSRQRIQDELNQYQARLRASGGTGTATFTIETKRSNLGPVLGLLKQVLREPELSEKELAEMKTQRLANIEQMKSEPQMLAMRAVQARVSNYPKGDVRHVETIEEEIESIRAVTPDTVKKLYKEFLGAGNGELVIVGDFDPAETLPLATAAIEDWKGLKPYARIEEPFQKDYKPGKEVIETPDKANAVYMACQPLAIRDDSPDYPALLIGNYILGGGAISSRLGNRLRQKDGLSYGAGSMFMADDQDERGRLMIFAICNPKNIDRVETGVREELEKILRDGVTADELEKAKAGYLQQRRVQWTNDRAVIGLLGRNAEIGRSMDYETQLEDKVRSLKVEDVSAALRKYFDPAKLVIVTGGDFKANPAGASK